MKVLFKRIFAFVLVFIVLDMTWMLCSDLWLFPNDIIGVYFEAPAPNNYKIIVFEPDHGIIADRNDLFVLEGIDSLKIIGNSIVGKRGAEYFSYDTENQEFVQFDSRDSLSCHFGIDSLSLQSPIDMYWEHRKPVDRMVSILISIIALAVSLLIKRKKGDSARLS